MGSSSSSSSSFPLWCSLTNFFISFFTKPSFSFPFSSRGGGDVEDDGIEARRRRRRRELRQRVRTKSSALFSSSSASFSVSSSPHFRKKRSTTTTIRLVTESPLREENPKFYLGFLTQTRAKSLLFSFKKSGFPPSKKNRSETRFSRKTRPSCTRVSFVTPKTGYLHRRNPSPLDRLVKKSSRWSRVEGRERRTHFSFPVKKRE